MELVTTLAGIGAIVDIWSEAPDELEETLAVMGATSDRAAALAVAAPVDCLMIPENLSSEVVGRRFYRQYVRPWETKWLAHIRQAGRVSFIHMDGTLKGLIADVAETGFDVIEAVTPLPVGDVAMGELRALAGPRPILWGGAPGTCFTPLVSDAEFDRHICEMLEVMVADRRMVLGVADQVPPDGLRSRVARVVELAQRDGQYLH
jgi:uroporphyrinogen-III decarboxylase